MWAHLRIFSRQANKIRRHPPLSLSGSLFPPLTFILTVRWNIKNSRERCAPESNVNGKRQRLRLGRLELGGTGPGIIISKWQVIWGNNRNSSVRQDAAKWSASAKWENDASLLSTVTQNVPSQSKKKLTKSSQEFMMRNFQKKEKKRTKKNEEQKIQQIYIVNIWGRGEAWLCGSSGGSSYLALSLNDLSTWTCN